MALEMPAGTALRIVLSLGVVLASVVVLARSLQRRRRGGATGWMTVLSSEPLAPGTELHLVRILDRYYVLSSGGGQVRLVTALGEDATVEETAAPADGEAETTRGRALGQVLSLDRLRLRGLDS